MKKTILFLLIAALLVMSGCAGDQPDPTQTIPPATLPKETTAPTEVITEPPTEPIPECTSAEVQVDDAPIILLRLNRGDVVDIVGEHDEEHYLVKTEAGYGLMEKQLLRLGGEPAYEVWTGYAYGGAKLYGNYQLTGEPMEKLNMNTQIQVLDELDYCYVVQVGEKAGFIRKTEVSRHYIQYSGGGGSGADGGDISLQSGGIVLLSTIEQSGEVTGQAEVLADGAQVVLGYFSRGEEAPVVTEDGFAPAWEGHYTVYINGMYGYLPINFVRADGEEAYAQWNGFCAYGSKVYDNYLLQGDGISLNINTEVTILWDGGDYYVVSINGDIGYMAKGIVSQTRYATGGGGGDDWTPPIK